MAVLGGAFRRTTSDQDGTDLRILATIGLVCGYVALFVLNLIAALIIFTSEVFGQYAGPEHGLGDYVTVVLLAIAAATVAGAIGSGFESEESVREATYSYRERERREALRRSRAAETDEGRDGPEAAQGAASAP
ncbi:hypothetical protein [Pseudonocardia nantongensis]|uniref:hypothetical protein n=1 Tax=Pseudonocardia nantongensis TaxID=1181885 RepID=UPI0039788217